MLAGKLNIVLDGQWGSTGKGKLSYYLAEKHDVKIAVCDFQTNAGHTVVLDDGSKHVFQQLPVSALKKDVMCLINPAATITKAKLLEEIEKFGVSKRLMIHPNACIVTEECKALEADMLKRIASTLKGVGAATGFKAMRHPATVLAKDVPELEEWIGDTTECLQEALAAGIVVLGEGAQGFDLSLNHGLEYPFVTSRDVTTAAFLSNAGVPPRLLGHVYGCLRTYPIRVGNHVEDGKTLGISGPHYEDQDEISWDQLKHLSHSERDLTEKTTVTQKVRRVFSFSLEQMKKFVRVCDPDFIFINFVNHLDAAAEGCKSLEELESKARGVVEWVKDTAYVLSQDPFVVRVPNIKYLGTGAAHSEMIEL